MSIAFWFVVDVCSRAHSDVIGGATSPPPAALAGFVPLLKLDRQVCLIGANGRRSGIGLQYTAPEVEMDRHELGFGGQI